MRRTASIIVLAASVFAGAARAEPTAIATDANRHLEHARALAGQGQHTRAIAEQTRALALEPARADALRERADAWAQKGQCDLAIADYNRALAIDNGDTKSLVGRGRCHHLAGNFDNALADYSLAARVSATPEVYNLRAQVYLALGDYSRGGADLRRAIDGDPREPSYLISLGITRYYRGEYGIAANNLARALRLRDDIRGALFLYLTEAKSGLKAHETLAQRAGYIRSRAWPYPLIEVYLGKRPLAEAMQLANSEDKMCEANYYAGELLILGGSRSDGLAALKQALRVCRRNAMEYAAAGAALRQLKAL